MLLPQPFKPLDLIPVVNFRLVSADIPGSIRRGFLAVPQRAVPPIVPAPVNPITPPRSVVPLCPTLPADVISPATAVRLGPITPQRGLAQPCVVAPPCVVGPTDILPSSAAVQIGTVIPPRGVPIAAIPLDQITAPRAVISPASPTPPRSVPAIAIVPVSLVTSLARRSRGIGCRTRVKRRELGQPLRKVVLHSRARTWQITAVQSIGAVIHPAPVGA